MAIVSFLIGCNATEAEKKEVIVEEKPDYISFAEDVAFMKEYVDIIQLSDATDKAKVAVSPALQGRVMTSSSANSAGRSYGWINRELFKSKDTFTLDNWYTPKLIDLEPFDVEKKTASSVTFSKKASLVNYSGFQFDFGIKREVSVLSTQEIAKELGVELTADMNAVAYKTTNSLSNEGKEDWKKETGLLSIWLLGMFNPAPETTIVVPYVSGEEAALGVPVNDNYFGKVPAERLIVKEDAIYFKGDGEYRSKIGLSPQRAKDVCGSYDATSQTLTIVKYNKPTGVTDYVNSLWELQDEPYAGDVINSYNDGAPEPGKKPLGPFYELETSSPALNLKVGEEGTHIQITAHFEGSPAELTKISEKVLGVSIAEIRGVFAVK